MTHGHMQGATVIAGIQVGFMEELVAPPGSFKEAFEAMRREPETRARVEALMEVVNKAVGGGPGCRTRRGA